MTMTETGHRATQFKKIIDTVPVLCADKNYRCIDDVPRTWIDLDQADITLSYPDANIWSNTYDIEIITVNSAAVPVADGSGTQIIRLEQQTRVLTQISRNSYYWSSIRNPKSSLKNILSLLPTRRP